MQINHKIHFSKSSSRPFPEATHAEYFKVPTYYDPKDLDKKEISMIARQNEKFVRQPALRLFAAELAESKQTIIEHIEGRDFDSRYQLTPTGVKAKRVLMMGALVEVDNVGTSGEYLRGRIIDPTGVFNVYAGRYQPEALLALSSLTVPCFVAVVGKTNAYRPDDETTIVSIRPETIVEIDARTRDYWVKETAAKTLERIGRSQLPETEKEKYTQICKDALTKLVYVPREISIPQPETPKEPTPLQEENIPDTELKERIFYLMNEGRCYEPEVGFLHPIINEEKPSPSMPASASEKHIQRESMTSADELRIREHKDEEPKDKILITSQASSVEEQPKPENEFYKTLRVQEGKESKTKRNNPLKRLTKKMKIERGSANSNQKTLSTEAPGQE